MDKPRIFLGSSGKQQKLQYFTTRSETDPNINARTSGVYLRANAEDLSILDGQDDRQRAELIAQRLAQWKSSANA